MATAPGAPALTTAAVRAIETLGGGQVGRADQIADRLAEAIRLGLIPAGERLPAEAALSEQLGVSTLTLREALATLRERGLVVTRRGRAGGSFVARSSGSILGREGLATLTVRQLREAADLRQANSGTAAALAARRASALEIEALRRRADKLAIAATPDERRRADSEFATELAAAAQSPRLAQQEANLRAELGDYVWSLMDVEQHAEAVRARHALVDAIADAAPDRARRSAETEIEHEANLLIQRRIDLYRAEGRSAPTNLEQTWAALADDIARVFQNLRQTADAFQASHTHATQASERYTLADLAMLRPRIHETLEAFSDLAVGTGIVVAPDVLHDAAHWLEWWWRRNDGTPEALRVNLDPDAPDYFDYLNDEWFDVPIRTKRQHVVGPYVDYACTNQYTFTLAVPVFEHDDRPLGIAAMDVLCDHLERRIMPALCSEPEPLVLLNSDGRLIAANTTGPAPGDRFAAHPGDAAVTRSAALTRLCEMTGWTVTAQ